MAAVLVLLPPLSCGEFQFDHVVQAACTGLHVQYVAFGGGIVEIKLRRIVERGNELVGKILRGRRSGKTGCRVTECRTFQAACTQTAARSTTACASTASSRPR